MTRFLLIFAISILMITGVSAQSPLVKGANEFTFDFYKASMTRTTSNVMISPLSISMALGMIYPGAELNTAAEMRETLHFLSSRDDQNAQFKELVNSISGPKSPLVVTNMAWFNRGTPYKDEFLKVLNTYFESSFRQVRFSDVENTRKLINVVIEDQTRGKIHDLIPTGIIQSNTLLVLTNALYFKDAWLNPFKPEDSSPGDFHAPGKDLRATFMKGKGYYNAFENEQVKILELPYASGDHSQRRFFSMLIILPKGDLQSFEENYFTLENLRAWHLRTTDMTKVMIPKFKFEHTAEVIPVLQKLGMIQAFSDNAEFTGICEKTLRINGICHKTFIEVNEEGTEAAAATAVGAVDRSLPPKGEFIADKPFIFLIKEKSTDSIVMIGRLVEP